MHCLPRLSESLHCVFPSETKATRLEEAEHLPEVPTAGKTLNKLLPFSNSVDQGPGEPCLLGELFAPAEVMSSNPSNHVATQNHL